MNQPLLTRKINQTCCKQRTGIFQKRGFTMIKKTTLSILLVCFHLGGQLYGPQENIYNLENENPNLWDPQHPGSSIPRNLAPPDSSYSSTRNNPEATYDFPNSSMDPVSSAARFPNNPVSYQGYNSNRGDEQNLQTNDRYE